MIEQSATAASERGHTQRRSKENAVQPTVTRQSEDGVATITVSDGTHELTFAATGNGTFTIAVSDGNLDSLATIEVTAAFVELVVDEMFAQIG